MSPNSKISFTSLFVSLSKVSVISVWLSKELFLLLHPFKTPTVRPKAASIAITEIVVFLLGFFILKPFFFSSSCSSLLGLILSLVWTKPYFFSK